jgi:hypothetical protein
VQLATAEQTAGRFAALLKINGVSQQEYDLNVLAVNNIKSDIENSKIILNFYPNAYKSFFHRETLEAA